MKRKTGIVLLCESYDELPSCFQILEKVFASKEQIGFIRIVVFSCEDLFDFFVHLNKENGWQAEISFVPLFPRVPFVAKSLKSWVEVIKNAYEERRFYRKYFSDIALGISEAQVYAFTRFINPSTQLFLLGMKDNNAIILRQVIDFEGISEVFIPNKMSELIKLIRQKMIFGMGYSFIHAPHRIMEYISSKFIHQCVGTYITTLEEEFIMKEYDITNINYWKSQDFKVVYYDQPIVQSGRVSAEEFAKCLEDVFNVLKDHFNTEDVAVKYHPGMHSENIIDFGYEVPRYVPGELLYSKELKIYISFSSGAITRIKDGVVISLLDMIEFKDDTAKSYIRQRLLERCSTDILLPKNKDELNQYIKEIVEVF